MSRLSREKKRAQQYDGRPAVAAALTWAFNLSGHPAISIPAGVGADGCPVGLQVVAAHGREAVLLAVAAAAEARAGVLGTPGGTDS